MAETLDDLRYPVGRLVPASALTPDLRAAAIEAIASLPIRMAEAVAGLGDRQLDTPYRPGGWTIRQLVHHVADSHIFAFTRLKLALTQERPAITPYDENAFAALPDARLPIDASLTVLEGVHARWTAVYRSMTGEQFARVFVHAEHGRHFTLDQQLELYSWHSRHHVAHITALRAREGWDAR